MGAGTAQSGTSAKWSPDARGGAAVDTGFYRLVSSSRAIYQ